MTAFEFVSINPFVGTNLRCPSGGYLRLSTSRRKDGQYRTVTELWLNLEKKGFMDTGLTMYNREDIRARFEEALAEVN